MFETTWLIDWFTIFLILFELKFCLLSCFDIKRGKYYHTNMHRLRMRTHPHVYIYIPPECYQPEWFLLSLFIYLFIYCLFFLSYVYKGMFNICLFQYLSHFIYQYISSFLWSKYFINQGNGATHIHKSQIQTQFFGVLSPNFPLQNNP